MAPTTDSVLTTYTNGFTTWPSLTFADHCESSASTCISPASPAAATHPHTNSRVEVGFKSLKSCLQVRSANHYTTATYTAQHLSQFSRTQCLLTSLPAYYCPSASTCVHIHNTELKWLVEAHSHSTNPVPIDRIILPVKSLTYLLCYIYLYEC